MLDLDNPVELARALMRCRSITPMDDGAMNILERALQELGFTCHRILGESPGTPDIHNLYARIGSSSPNLCFAGHTDVVPIGSEDDWTHEPFNASIHNDKLYGRGATDMKGAIAAFVCATKRFTKKYPESRPGSISLLITGDEEGPAVNGTTKVLKWLTNQNEIINDCIVGEPTNPNDLGEMVKIGRRGSLNGTISVFGTQGHVAYPHLANNPIPQLAHMISLLCGREIDQGTEHFQPSNIEFSSVDVGNTAQNVIPAKAAATFNIRFNNIHTSESLKSWVKDQIDTLNYFYEIDFQTTGEPFICPPGIFTDIIKAAIEAQTGLNPTLSTTGGTSDARFIKDHCNVAEFGLISQTMHKTDEYVELSDLNTLANIYEDIIERYFYNQI